MIGSIFGLFDWYYGEWLAQFPWEPFPAAFLEIVLRVSLLWGIWLVPALPVAVWEAVRSQRIWRSALATALLWSCAIVTYYLYYGFLMAFDGEPPLSLFQALRTPAPNAWQTWWVITQTLTLRDIREWSLVALVGGALVGGSIGVVVKYIYWQSKAH